MASAVEDGEMRSKRRSGKSVDTTTTSPLADFDADNSAERESLHAEVMDEEEFNNWLKLAPPHQRHIESNPRY
eukprot:343683-Pleurochrysis_carterae.AAC.1